MKITLINIFVIVFVIACSSGKQIANEQKPSVVGKYSWQEWLAQTHWDIIPTYDYYFPEKSKIDKLKELINGKNISFVVFATTTCEECREYVPRAFKIFHELGIKDENISLYGLDQNLEEPTKEYLKYDIPTTPVVYVKENDKIIAEVSYPFLWLETFLEVFEDLK